MRIITRSEWGADPRSFPAATMRLPATAVYLHHSVSTVTDYPIADMRSIERIGLTRFGQVSYSYVIHPHDGEILEGCGLRRGAHTAQKNSTSFGICWVGNYEERAPKAQQLDATRWLINELTKQGHLQRGAPILGHRDTGFATACLPLDVTEVLTDRGWKALGDVTLEDRVASWVPWSGQVRFKEPIALIEPYEDEVIAVGPYEMTADHRLYALNQYHQRRLMTAGSLTKGSDWFLPRAGRYSGPGLTGNPDLVRALVWVQADGHYQQKNDRLDCLRFHLKKPRKIERITDAFRRLGVEVRRTNRADGTVNLTVYGIEWLRANVLRYLPERRFTWDWLDLDADEFAALDDEILHADGCVTGNFFASSDTQNLDIIQALYVLNGRAAGKVSPGNRLSLPREGTKRAGPWRMVRRGEPLGRRMVSCLTTSTDSFIIRQHGQVVVVGNCPGSKLYAVLDVIRHPWEETMPDDPSLPNLPDIKFFVPIVGSDGVCKGYYIVSSDGQLHAFGPGAPFHGRSEVPS